MISNPTSSLPSAITALLILISAIPRLGAADVGITDIRRISPGGGTFSFARFTDNGRFVLAAASGEPFGKCPHIFRFDLSPNGNPVSLASSGFGWEQSIGIKRAYKAYIRGYSMGSTAAEDWKRVIATRPNGRAVLTEETLCSVSRCDSPATNDIRLACNQKHIERRRKALIYPTGTHFEADPQLESDAEWENPRESLDELSIYSRKPKDGVAGEQIILTTDSGEKQLRLTANWADGFEIDDSKSELRILFAGAKAEGSALNALNQGVIPIRGSKIYEISKLAAGTPTETVLVEDQTEEFSFLAPSVSKGLPGVVIYTKIRNSDGKAAIVKMERSSTGAISRTDLTDFKTNSRFGRLSPDGKYLTFISDRDGQPDQLYVATMGIRPLPEPEYPTKAPSPPNYSISKQLTNVVRYGSFGIENRRLRITPNLRTIMYQTQVGDRGCSEVHQLRIDLNDGIARRRLSSGLQNAESPNWLNDDSTADVLMSAEVLRPFADSASLQHCQLGTCEFPLNAEMRDACESVRQRSFARTMHKEAELVIVSQFGLLRERITFNEVWDGEVRVSPERTFMVFERKGTDTYELWKANLDGSQMEKLNIPEGRNFAFDLAFSHDSNFLVYAAYRPETDQQKVQFDTLLKFDTVDIQYSNLYVYNLDTNEETKFIDGFKSKARCRSPIYIQGMNRVAFQYSADGYFSTHTYAGSFDFDENKQHEIDLRLTNEYTDHLIYKQNGKYRMVVSDFGFIYVGDFSIEKPVDPDDDPKPRTEPTKATNPPTTTTSSALGNGIGIWALILGFWLFL